MPVNAYASDGPQSDEPATVYIDVGESYPATPLGTFTLSGTPTLGPRLTSPWTSAPNEPGSDIGAEIDRIDRVAQNGVPRVEHWQGRQDPNAHADRE